MKSVGIACTLCLASVVRAAVPDPLLKLVEQPVLWATFDWPKVAVSAMVRDPQWRVTEPTTKPGEPYTSSFSKRTLQLRGVEWDAVWQPGEDPVSGAFFVSKDMPLSECEAAALDYGKALGKPVFSDGSVRFSISETDKMTLTHRRWEWTVGATRINASCTGLSSSGEGPNNLPSLSLSFKSAARSAALVPPFMLRCGRTYASVNGQLERKFDDLVFWVVPGSPKSTIKTPTNDAISSSAEVDETSIAFTQETKAGPVRYLVSRITGSLTADARDSKGELFGRMSGSCEKTTTAAKF